MRPAHRRAGNACRRPDRAHARQLHLRSEPRARRGLVGLDAAKALIFSGRLIDADAALRAGFLSEVVASDDVLHARAQALADSLTELAPLTLRATKEMARRLRAATPLPHDHDLIRLCYGSADFREGLTSFLDKRPARWTGT